MARCGIGNSFGNGFEETIGDDDHTDEKHGDNDDVLGSVVSFYRGAPPGNNFDAGVGPAWPNVGWYSHDDNVPTAPSPALPDDPECDDTSEGSWDPDPNPPTPNPALHVPPCRNRSRSASLTPDSVVAANGGK